MIMSLNGARVLETYAESYVPDQYLSGTLLPLDIF